MLVNYANRRHRLKKVNHRFRKHIMDTLQRIAAVARPTEYTYDFFFNKIEYCLSKGKGFSVFNADEASITAFLKRCTQKGFAPLALRLSSLESVLSSQPALSKFVIIIQDLPYADFLERASLIADKLIFPLWFQRIPICFFSPLSQGAYQDCFVTGEELHKNISTVIHALLAEQVCTILDRVNYQFSSPDFLPLPEYKTVFTPIEEKLLRALEAHQLTYEPQIRIRGYTVDFLVGTQNKVIVECDGRTYHDAYKDVARDKVLALEGYPICRFSGSDIHGDVDQCIEIIQKALRYNPSASYAVDNDLDSSQQAAATSINGPIRVLAPAGSGKTKTLVNRILHMLNQGIPAEKILALAFNKKARDEMQDRLSRRGVEGIEVRTFHSLGYEIVREGLGWSFQGSSSKKTSKALMKSAILEHTELPPLRNKDPLDAFLAGLRRAKMELPALATVTIEYGDRIYPLESIFYSYIKKQLDTNFLDFDDMIYLAIRVLMENNSMRSVYQFRFEYVLVDEFQDLNEAQLLLLQIIALPENNIFAVGDDDQMIYGFRGADVKHILQFDKRFPIASNHVLNTNYRSSQMIVRHSGWLINHNTDRIPKNIQPRKNAQLGKFEVSGHASLYEQADYAAKWLARHKQEHNLHWRDYAILYRSNAYQFPIGVMLDTLNIPHAPLSGQHLFQTTVGTDVYSYLKIILFPREASVTDFEQILKRPNKYFTNQLIAQARNWNAFRRLADAPNLRTWEQEKLTDFIQRVEMASRQARASNISSADFMKLLGTEFGLGDFYKDQSRKSDDLDQASDEVLFDVIIALAENFKTPLEFYQYMCKSLDDSNGDEENGGEERVPKKRDHEENEVYLSTIHKAKGKEFQNVIYFNLSQAEHTSQKAQFVEEERRVAYVGATRAKDDLLITFSATKPSDFLAEISLDPKFKILTNEELKQKHASATRRLRKEEATLKQLQLRRDNTVVLFNELVKQHSYQRPDWFALLFWEMQNWRIHRVQVKIEWIDRQIKKHMETIIDPLIDVIREMEAEETIRAALGMKS
jgi:DNA helicase-2/ATP-dependent DNA helicase PcrA